MDREELDEEFYRVLRADVPSRISVDRIMSGEDGVLEELDAERERLEMLFAEWARRGGPPKGSEKPPNAL
jgi:hypothetical protein